MQYLVLGASGYVGGYLYQRMKETGRSVIGTGRTHENGLVYYDTMKDSLSSLDNLMEAKEKAAIICVAQTNFDRCQTEYELSRQINVVSMTRVIEELVQHGYYIVYFSTDNVFDGTTGDYTEQDATNAISKYGKMKEEMEHFLAEDYPEVCLYRMPRVVGIKREKKNLLTDFEDRIADEVIRCIKGNQMSVIAQEDIFQACLIAADEKLHGIYNLSNGEKFSRKGLAEKFFDAMGAFNKKIIELDLEEFGFKDIRPLNTTLDNSKFRQRTGYDFMTYDRVVEEYLVLNGYK